MTGQEALKNFRITYSDGRQEITEKTNWTEFMKRIKKAYELDPALIIVEVKKFKIIDEKGITWPIGFVSYDEYMNGVADWKTKGKVVEITT